MNIVAAMATPTTLRTSFALLTALALAACTTSSTSGPDAAAADSAAADSTTADSTTADSTTADSTAADSTAADSTAADSTAADSATPAEDAATGADTGGPPIDYVGGPGARACFSMSPNRACVDCCGTLSSDGGDLYNALIAYECGCRDLSPCSLACNHDRTCSPTLEWANAAVADSTCLSCLRNSAANGARCVERVREMCTGGDPTVIFGLKSANCGGFLTCASRCPYDVTPGWVRLSEAPMSCGSIMGSFTGTCQRCEVEPNTCQLRCQCIDAIGARYVTANVSLMGCTGDIANCGGTLRCGGCDALTPGWVRPANAPAACGNTMGSYSGSCRRCEVEPSTCQLRCECPTSAGEYQSTSVSLTGCTGDIANCNGMLRCRGCG